MKKLRIMSLIIVLLAAVSLMGTSSVAMAQSQGKARLTGYQEVPPLSTNANGTFTMKVNEKQTRITYTLEYEDFDSDVRSAHIHFGQLAVEGGVMMFLCDNTDSAPAGTPACPDRSGKVQGTLTDADVVGPAAQGIDDGEFGEALKAIRTGKTYVNVHTEDFPDGELRGQIGRPGQRN